MEEKWLKRLDLLIKLLDLLDHGKAQITWSDCTIVKIEKLETEATIKK